MNAVEELCGDASRRDFNAVLSEVGARLLEAPRASLDEVIEDVLGRLIELLDVDLAAVRHAADDDGTKRVTHRVARIGVERIPSGSPDARFSMVVDSRSRRTAGDHRFRRR